MNINRDSEQELIVLESIKKNQSNLHQRDLAHIVGLSLGMTNGILKRLVKKGLLKIRKINNRNVKYIVSSKGLEELARRSYRYFRRTIKNVVYYRMQVNDYVIKLKKSGYDRIVIVGKSDIDFIVEHCCIKNSVQYTNRYEDNCGIEVLQKDFPGSFFLFSENMFVQLKNTGSSKDCAYIRELFV